MTSFENDIAVSGDAKVAVIGVGGAGCKIASMLYGKMSRVGVIAVNTDRKALENTQADVRLYICKEVTKGLGTNGDPALGKKCAQIHEAEILSAVSMYDSAIIVTGLGGGTGTGASAVIAELCNRAGVSVGAVAVMPFSFESGRSSKAAEGYRALSAVCPRMIRCENDKLLTIPGIKTLDEAMITMNGMIVRKIQESVEYSKVSIREFIGENIDAGKDVSGATECLVANTDTGQKSI